MKLQELQPSDDSNSNSFLYEQEIAPLPKRQSTAKKPSQSHDIVVEKIDSLAYQIVEELSIITPLDLPTYKLFERVKTYYFQRKATALLDHQSTQKNEREKADFVMAMTSLFKKAWADRQYKFAIVLPLGGIIYFLVSEDDGKPKVVVSTPAKEMGAWLKKEKIAHREMREKSQEKEKLLVEGQYIKLLFGFLLNWLIEKHINVEIYANYLFEMAYIERPLVFRLQEQRKEYEELKRTEKSFMGQKTSQLHLYKFQGVWFRDDISQIEHNLRRVEAQRGVRSNGELTHDLEFKVMVCSVGIDNDLIDSASTVELQ